MIDYDKIDREFTELLMKWDSKKFEEWNSRSKFRRSIAIFLDGELIDASTTVEDVVRLSDKREMIEYTDNTTYALAA
jgi:hypothetical protein